VTLVATPYIVGWSPRAGALAESALGIRRKGPEGGPSKEPEELLCSAERRLIIVVGMGPAGRSLLKIIKEKQAGRISVIDVNPKNADAAEEYGVGFTIGDAGKIEVLEKAGLHRACVIVITLPDPGTARRIIHLCRSHSPNINVISRVRYDMFAEDILDAGASAIVNEEVSVGEILAGEMFRLLGD